MKNNANNVARRLYRKASLADPLLAEAGQKAARELTQLSHDILLREVYLVPVRLSKTGRPLWKRTDELITLERFESQGLNVRHVNESGHSIWRYRYGTATAAAGQKVAIPPQQVSHWYTEAIQKYFPRLMQLRRDAIRRALEAGGSGPAPQEND